MVKISNSLLDGSHTVHFYGSYTKCRVKKLFQDATTMESLGIPEESLGIPEESLGIPKESQRNP